MPYYGSGYNPIQNRDYLIKYNNGVAYNAVVSAEFSDESATEPVTLQEAKDWCKIDVSDDDSLITELIKGARLICELHSNISFIERTVTAVIVNGLGRINLPYGPVTSEVAYYDDDETELDDYSLKTADDCRVQAVYSAGYETLPKNLKTALLNQILWMYENRGDEKLSNSLSEEAKLILNQVRRPS